MLSAGLSLALACLQSTAPAQDALMERKLTKFELPADTQGAPAKRKFTYVSSSAGPVKVHVLAADFVPLIVVRDAAGKRAAEVGQEGELETIVTISAAAGETLQIVVGTSDGWTGKFLVVAHNGEMHTLAPAVARGQWIDMHEAGLEDARDEKEDVLEAHHRLALASAALARGEPARAALEVDQVLGRRAFLEPNRQPPHASPRSERTKRNAVLRAPLTPHERAADVLYRALHLRAQIGLASADPVVASDCLEEAFRVGVSSDDAMDTCTDLIQTLTVGQDVLGVSQARALLTAALAEKGPVLPRDLRAQLLGARADLDRDAGVLDEAERGYKAALETATDEVSREYRRYWYGFRGEVLAARGRYTEALACARASLDRALVHAFDDGGSRQICESLLSLGDLFSQLGESEDAIAAYEAALDLAVGEDSKETRAQLLISLAAELKLLERWTEARACLESALPIAEQPGEGRTLASVRISLVETYDQPQQRDLRRAALAEAERVVGVLHNPELDTYLLSTQAWEKRVQEDPAGALPLARDACERFRSLKNPEEELHALGTLVWAATALGLQDEARSGLERANSGLQSWTKMLSAENGASLRRAYREWAGLQQDVVSLELARAGTDLQAAESARSEGLRYAQHWKIRSLLDTVSPPEPVHDYGVEPLREALKDHGTWLIEYANGVDALYAYVIGRDFFTRVDLGSWKEIEQQAALFVRYVSRPGEPSSSRQIATLGHALYLRLIAPALAALPQGEVAPERLILVPTVGLSVLPFDALLARPMPEKTFGINFAEWPFLMRDLEIDYVPSSALLVLLSERKPRKGPGMTLIVASSRYASAPASISRSSPTTPAESFSDLPSALDEANSIVRAVVARETPEVRAQLEEFILHCDVPPNPVQGSRLALYLDQHATRQCLLDADERYSQIYCITHGEVNLAYPERTGLVLTPGPAGYERFTCADLENVKLDADVVVLSACSTALGKPLRGEGIQSLANAFLKANARGVIATLWEVLDDKTNLLFGTKHYDVGGQKVESFHQAVADGIVPPAKALREAKRASWSRARGSSAGPEMTDRPRYVDGADPYYWAAFVYAGTVR